MTETETETHTPTVMLDQDTSIRGQKYALISFVSPEDVILKKEVFMFDKFLEHFSSDVENLLIGILACPDLRENQTIKDMVSNVRERHACIFNPDDMSIEYTFFKNMKGDELEKEYLEKNNFQTSIRGFKIRGSYETLPEAKKRGELLSRIDKDFNIFVCEVGCWSPWSPDPNDVAESEFRDSRLNTLLKKYKEAGDLRDTVFEGRKEALMSKSKLTGLASEPPPEIEMKTDQFI